MTVPLNASGEEERWTVQLCNRVPANTQVSIKSFWIKGSRLPTNIENIKIFAEVDAGFVRLSAYYNI